MGAGNSPIDLFNVLNRFTLDSIGEIGFGADVGSLEKPDSPFLASFDRAQQLFMKSGEAPSDKLLEDLVLNFLIAGRDTTAQAMSWCLWNIMQHPEVERGILAEADT